MEQSELLAHSEFIQRLDIKAIDKWLLGTHELDSWTLKILFIENKDCLSFLSQFLT